MNTPTPRTDAATYPADCLFDTLVTNRDCSRALERELTAITAELTVALANWNGALERAMKAEADLAAAKERLRSEAMDDYASIKNLQRELAAERARLDAGTILLTVAGERVWHCGVDLRAAIDAGMREGAK